MKKNIDEKFNQLVNIAKEQHYKLGYFEIIKLFKENDIQDIIEKLDKEGIDIVYDDDIELSSVKQKKGKCTKIESPYDPNKISIITKSVTLDSIIKRINNEELDFDMKFQRKADLWDNKRKSQLIESIILRIPLPAFYFDSTNDDKWQIIDGLQRVSTIKSFVIDKEFKLENLEFLDNIEGCTYDKLPRVFQRRIEETNIIAYLILPTTPKNVKYNIFKRLNTGGLILTSQEIRNALYQGPATEFLEKLSNNTVFQKICNISTDRMLDKEYCLRYLAAIFVGYEKYANDMDEFLNGAMDDISKWNVKKLNLIEKSFPEDIKNVYAIMDNFSFRKIIKIDDSSIKRGPINKALFEAWCIIIHKMSKGEINTLTNKREELIDAIISLYDENSFQGYLRSSDKGSINKRIEKIQECVSKVLGG